MKKIKEEILEKIQPNKEEIKEITKISNNFLKKIKSEIKNQGINADPFIGGSFAKGTLIKKNKYDIDVFIRFDKKYKNSEISIITNKILNKIKNNKKVHGSRDYYRVDETDNLFFEVVPVTKISKPENAKNTTDLSYFHVKYFKNKLKDEKIKQEIMLAKAFCDANKCYGAESHIKGFSGYSLEILIYYYKSFEKFLKDLSKINLSEVIDIEKHYKNKKEVFLNLNTSKLESPIILIDPTFKQRNALAGLSKETFKNFQQKAREFIKKPSKDFFIYKKIDIAQIKNKAKKKNKNFIFLEIKTDKQEGAIAGSKLLKFYALFLEEIKKYFEVYEKGFEYNEKKSAKIYLIIEPKKEIILKGPFIEDKNNINEFKKHHKNIFEKNKRAYAKEKINYDIKEFVNLWKKKYKKTIKEMSIKEVKIVDYQKNL